MNQQSVNIIHLNSKITNQIFISSDQIVYSANRISNLKLYILRHISYLTSYISHLTSNE